MGRAANVRVRWAGRIVSSVSAVDSVRARSLAWWLALLAEVVVALERVLVAVDCLADADGAGLVEVHCVDHDGHEGGPIHRSNLLLAAVNKFSP